MKGEKTAESYADKLNLLDKEALADLFHCSKRQIDCLRERRNLPYVKLGGLVRFDLQEVKRWLMQNMQGLKVEWDEEKMKCLL